MDCRRIATGLWLGGVLAFWVPGAAAQDPPAATAPATSAVKAVDPEAARAALERAIQGVAEEARFHLKYRLQPGMEHVWDCEHTTSTSTRIAGESEKSTSRTQWTTRWKTERVNPAGQMSFSSVVEQFSLWQQLDEKPAVTFSSTDSKNAVPEEFAAIADTLNPAPSRFTIAANGRVVTQESGTQKQLVGFGEITIPFPDEAIPAGFRWYVNRQLTARDEDHSTVRVATRIGYELSRVKGNLAYLTFRTDVLTPGLSPTVRSQIMQNMARGYIVFDMQQGLVSYRETEWNEKVQSFAGADSYLLYVAKSVQRLRSKPDDPAMTVSRPAALTDPNVAPASHQVPSSQDVFRPLQPILPKDPAGTGNTPSRGAG